MRFLILLAGLVSSSGWAEAPGPACQEKVDQAALLEYQSEFGGDIQPQVQSFLVSGEGDMFVYYSLITYGPQAATYEVDVRQIEGTTDCDVTSVRKMILP